MASDRSARVAPAVTGEPATPATAERSRRRRNIGVTILATAAIIWLLQFMQSILIPFVVSGLLFYALDAPVDALQRLKVPRVIGAAAMLLVVVAGVGGLAYSLQTQAMTVIDQLPSGARRLATALDRKPNEPPGALAKVQEAAEALETTTQPKTSPGVVRVQVEEPRTSASSYLLSSTVSAASVINQVVMVLFLTYFMLLSDQLFKRKLVEIAGPTLSRKKVTVQALEEIATRIERFLMIQIFTSVVVGTVTWLALLALGLHQAALWGLIAGLLNSIPYYGPLLVTGALAAVGFLQFGDFGRSLLVAAVSLVITALEGYLLTPALVGKAAEMNSVSVFAGLLFWSWAWGIWGLLLAVPMMMVIKVVCDHVEDLQPIGVILGE
jgi:predicted PurR-regulated permease PerM